MNYLDILLRTLGKSLQRILITIPQIRITAVGVRVRVLPEALVRPASRNSANGASVLSKHQRVVTAERSAISCAGAPPIGSTVDHGVSTSLAVVGFSKVLDPGNHV